VGNDGVNSGDILGLAGVNILTIEVRRDSSFEIDKDKKFGMKWRIQNHLDVFKKVRKKCCHKYGIGCNVRIKFDVKLDTPSNTAPDEYGYKEYESAAGQLTTGQNARIPVLFTNRQIRGDLAGGMCGEGRVPLVNLSSDATTMSHEIGHGCGYILYRYRKEEYAKNAKTKDRVDMDRKLLEDKEHSNLKGDLMYPKSENVGIDPDKCYCRKVFRAIFNK
jgi:hypothetical protein